MIGKSLRNAQNRAHRLDFSCSCHTMRAAKFHMRWRTAMLREQPHHSLVASSPNERMSTNKNHRPRHLLIVDDNELTCKQLQKALQMDASLQVDFRTDGTQALETLEQANYSILLTDLCMPNLSGMELIHQIQERGLPVTVI